MESPGADTLRKLAAALALSVAVISCGYGKTVEPAPPPDFPPRVVETFEPQTLTAEIEILTIPGTERNDNKLCTYNPTEYGLYRLVGDVINDEDFRFSSNWLSH